MADVSAPTTDVTAARCAGRGVDYEYTAVPGKRWIEKRAYAVTMLCHGCPLLDGTCARLAVDTYPNLPAMVWSGVPVPPDHSGDRNRARRLLEEMASHAQPTA